MKTTTYYNHSGKDLLITVLTDHESVELKNGKTSCGRIQKGISTLICSRTTFCLTFSEEVMVQTIQIIDPIANPFSGPFGLP